MLGTEGRDTNSAGRLDGKTRRRYPSPYPFAVHHRENLIAVLFPWTGRHDIWLAVSRPINPSNARIGLSWSSLPEPPREINARRDKEVLRCIDGVP